MQRILVCDVGGAFDNPLFYKNLEAVIKYWQFEIIELEHHENMVEDHGLVIFILLVLWDISTEDEPLLEGFWIIENDLFVFLQDLKNEFHVEQVWIVCLEWSWRLLLIFNTRWNFEVNLIEPVIAYINENVGKSLGDDLFEELAFRLLDIEELLFGFEGKIVYQEHAALLFQVYEPGWIIIEFDGLGNAPFRELLLQDVLFTFADLVQRIQSVTAADCVRSGIELLRWVWHFWVLITLGLALRKIGALFEWLTLLFAVKQYLFLSVTENVIKVVEAHLLDSAGSLSPFVKDNSSFVLFEHDFFHLLWCQISLLDLFAPEVLIRYLTAINFIGSCTFQIWYHLLWWDRRILLEWALVFDVLGIQKHLNNPFRVAESAQSIEIWRFTKLKDAPNQEVGLLFALSKIELGATRSGKILVELGGSALGLEKLRARAHLADILLVQTMLILLSNGGANLILARRPRRSTAYWKRWSLLRYRRREGLSELLLLLTYLLQVPLNLIHLRGHIWRFVYHLIAIFVWLHFSVGKLFKLYKLDL